MWYLMSETDLQRLVQAGAELASPREQYASVKGYAHGNDGDCLDCVVEIYDPQDGKGNQETTVAGLEGYRYGLTEPIPAAEIQAASDETDAVLEELRELRESRDELAAVTDRLREGLIDAESILRPMTDTWAVVSVRLAMLNLGNLETKAPVQDQEVFACAVLVLTRAIEHVQDALQVMRLAQRG